MQVLVTRDRVWRLERHQDGWCRLYQHGGLVLSRASVDEAREHLEAAGVDVVRDLVPG